jgi:hypothetical protein
MSMSDKLKYAIKKYGKEGYKLKSMSYCVEN